MTTNNKISNLVNSQTPFFVRNDHANFVTFLEQYYKFLEQNNQPVSVLRENLPQGRDIDRTVYEDKLYDEYLKLIPDEAVADKALLLKHIKDFYIARGTEKSIKFLLSILFGEENVTFYYPKKDILRASDGKWFVRRTLRVEDVKVDNTSNNDLSIIQNFAGKVITGANSGATAIGEYVDRFYENGTQINEITISSIIGTFENGEEIISYYEGDEVVISPSVSNTPVFQLSANIFGGILNSIDIIDGGTNYNVGDPVIVESNTGSGATAIVSRVSTGNISSITVIEGGAGYKINDYVLFTGGGGSDANAYISTVTSDGSSHPNSYNIIISLLSSEANTNLVNSTANNVYESFAYRNLRTISTITSNLTANTFGALSELKLHYWSGAGDAWKQNSNTFFETFDTLNLTNTITGVSNLVYITSSNIQSNLVYISPSFGSPQSNLRVQVIKKANANTSIIDACDSFVYDNTGPAQIITIGSAGGSGYTEIPSIALLGNTRIQELGILGKMDIINGGTGYDVGDVIEFINISGGYGTGAAGNVKTVNGTGSITSVQFIPVSGQITGGSGYITYGTPYLPLANVISGTGTGANVVVSALLGMGGTFDIANTTLGMIERISITNRGSGYTSIPTINLESSGDGSAEASATIIDGVFEYPGRWLNDDGHLSSTNYLENRDYYQPFSYVVRSGVSISKYRKALKDLTHPAGMKLFGAYVQTDEQNEYVPETEGINEEILLTSTKTYFSNGNTIINYTSHGLSVGNVVYLTFMTGNISNYANRYSSYQPNAIYRVANVINSDTFYINSGRNRLPASMNLRSAAVGFQGISGVESSHQDVFIRKDDERKIYMLGAANDLVYEYRMDISGDITTANISNVSNISLSLRESTPRGFDISSDGRHIYFVGGTSGNTVRAINQYSMGEAWNIRSMYYSSNTYNLVPRFGTITVQGTIRINQTGNIIFIADTTNDTIYQYTLSENWNVSSANSVTQKFIGGLDSNIVGMDFNYTGNVIYITGATNDRITSFGLDTSWNVNTANFSTMSNSVTFTNLDTSPTGIAVSNDGTMIYISGVAGGFYNYALHQFPVVESGNVNTAIISIGSSGNVRVGKIV